MRWSLLVVPLLGVLCQAGEIPARSAEFLMIGDWGRDPVREPKLHAQQRAVAAGMAKVAAGSGGLTAVLALGDNQYDGVPTAEDPVFRTAFEEVYAAPALQVPFWAVLGNHEYSGSALGQMAYSARRLGSGRWTQPARYWSRVTEVGGGAKAKFVFLDTSVFIRKYRGDDDFSDIKSQDPAAQLAWLGRELAEPGMTWRIVIGHHPAWVASLRDDGADIRRAVLPALLAGKADLYASGHEHHPEVVRRDGLLQLIAGNGSECRPPVRTGGALYQGEHLGFASLSLSARRMTLRQHDETGAVRFELAVDR